MKKILLATAMAAAAIPASANASVIVSSLPEFNGNGAIGNTFIGIFNYVIPVGENIISAVLTSRFGNSVVNSSAQGFLTVEGVQVGECLNTGPCSTGPGVPVSFNFLPSQFALLADGSADLFYDQTGCCIIRLSESTLTITTGNGVPEPATWAMMIFGFGLVGSAMRGRVRTSVTYA